MKLKNGNLKCTFAGLGISILFEKGKLMVKKHTLFFFCSHYIHIKTLSYSEIALKLLYVSKFKSYSHLKFSRIFVFCRNRFHYINFTKQSA